MIFSRKLKLQDCTLTTVLIEPSKIVVSAGEVRVTNVGVAHLTDDVEYTIPIGDPSVRSVMGYLVLVRASGELDVLIDEILSDGSKLIHDWKHDTEHIYLHPVFSADLGPSQEARIVLWGATEG
jgi:hypothetical protein